MMNVVRYLLPICATIFFLTAGAAVAGDPTVAAVQQALTEFGYRPGPVDGLMGNRTSNALSQFSRDAGGPASSAINQDTLLKLGLTYAGAEEFDEPMVQRNPLASILVIDERAENLNNLLSGMTQAEIVDFLPKLFAKDTKKIDLVFERPKSIVFIVHMPLRKYQVVQTYHSNILKGVRNEWHETYDYMINGETPKSPLIIINEFETSNPMFIVSELIVDGKVVAQRLTRAGR